MTVRENEKVMKRTLVAVFMMVAVCCHAQINISIRYSAPDGGAVKYMNEMVSSGLADEIRAIPGCLRYDYFIPQDAPAEVLLLDSWEDRAALDRYHASAVMKKAEALRAKYHLQRKVEMLSSMNPDMNNQKSISADSTVFQEIVASRYSCKKFSDRQISKQQLDAILEAGRLAPTAKNLQEQHVYVVQSAEALAKIDANTPCRYGAPTCLVVAFDKNNVFTYPGGKRDSGVEDASIVATHMILAAQSVGVNSCWINYFDPDKLAADLGLPENEEILMIMDLGFAAEGAGPLKPHFSRKPIEETVTYL